MANKCPQCGFEAKDGNELREHMKAHKGSGAGGTSGTTGGSEEM